MPTENMHCLSINLLVLTGFKHKMIIFLIISNPGAVIRAKSIIESVI